MKQLGHTMYNPAIIEAKLAIQRSINPTDATSRTSFRYFCSESSAVWRLLGNLGRTSTHHLVPHPWSLLLNQPRNKCLPGPRVDFHWEPKGKEGAQPSVHAHNNNLGVVFGQRGDQLHGLQGPLAVKASSDTLWMPVAGEDTSGAIQVPHLLAILNVLVDLLCTQGTIITPHNVLMMIDDFTLSSPHPAGPQWECVWKWYLVAGQSGANENSKVFLETSPITIDDNDFDCWVSNCLDISLGPRPSGAYQATAGPAGNTAFDYLALLRMLAMTIRTTMMHFNQAVAPQGRGGARLTDNKTALSTGKWFDQNQIAKLKDARGVRNAKQIPQIWSNIEATKRKSFDSYRAHFAKSIDA
jgi:hypothetical protein